MKRKDKNIGDSVSRGKRFKKTVEDFVCDNCGLAVNGDGYTDHCPKCLYSKHVDVMPGDRSNSCLGSMHPTSTVYKKDTIIIYYICEKCSARKSVTSNSKDDSGALEKLLGFLKN